MVADEDIPTALADSLATTTVLCLALGEHFIAEGTSNGHDFDLRRGVVLWRGSARSVK